MVVGLVPEFLAVTVVAVVSLVTKVASLEVTRQASCSLDREFTAHGIGNLAAVPLGGIACSLQTGTSRLLEQAGGATRMSGVVCSLVMGVVAVAHLDLPGAIPVPIVAGLVFYLGYTFVIDALGRPYKQRAWLDLTLALVITLACLRYGYLVGVLAGLVGACVHFALSYARLGVVRRHASRAVFASHVDRTATAMNYLRDTGEAIQIYWLSGYIFFGSSEGVFERIREDIEALERHRARYVILDCAMVPGADSSAIASLAKLHHFCNQRGITLVYCALRPVTQAAMQRGGFFGGKSPHQAFADLQVALAWCEDQLLVHAGHPGDGGIAGFEPWLQDQLGPLVRAGDLLGYLERKDTADGEVLYREGEPADSIDLVAAGTLGIDMDQGGGHKLRVRRITTHTVLGEMGFVRHTVRSATVSSEGPATVFTMRRASFERMRREHAALASAFDDFILRALADRMDAANRAVAALRS
jgi:SulP family sulfate permease